MANAVIDEIDKAVFEDGRGTYGALCVNGGLGHFGGASFAPRGRPRAQCTQAAEVPCQLHDDHVAGALTQDSPDRVWIADVTQPCADADWLHRRFAIGVFDWHIVGWAMDDVLNTDRLLSALLCAQQVRRSEPGWVHHSVQGWPYCSFRFGRHLRATGVFGGRCRSGALTDHAVAESVFANFQTGLLDWHHWRTRDTLHMAIFELIEDFCSRQRRHSRLEYLRPAEYQRRRHEQQAQARVTSP